MEIKICQTCASILRDNARFCTGCGASVSEHSSTTVNTGEIPIPALSLEVKPDPRTIDSTLNQREVVMLDSLLKEAASQTPAAASPKTSAKQPSKKGAKPAARPAGNQKQSPGALKNLNDKMGTAGATVSKLQMFICGVVLTVICMQAYFAISGMLQQSAKPPSLVGSWEFSFQTSMGQQQYGGQMQIFQSGNTLQGNGQDQAQFSLAGSYTPPTVKLSKQYVVNGQPSGQPVVWDGKVNFPNNEAASMTGTFQVKQGLGTIRGTWSAHRTLMPPPEVEPPSNNNSWLPRQQDGQVDWSKLFTAAFFAMVFLGVLLYVASLKLFGPAGLVNIWSKKDYIPSQFKSQHKNLLKDLGKPLTPGGLPLGARQDWHALKVGEPKELNLPAELRDQNPHVLVIGSGAKGKSRLLANMISHDIASGDRAVCVIDSDGHLVDLILRWLSAHPKGKDFARRVRVIDPTDSQPCLGYNPLAIPDDGDYQSAASAIVYGFKAIYAEPPGAQSQWNQQTANILRNCALLLAANGRTLTDLPVLLMDNDFRDIMLDNVEKRKNERAEFITLLEAWGNYKKLARTDQWIQWTEPILNRVSPMLGDPRIRPILTSPSGGLNLKQIIQERQVLLVRIPQGELDQNASLLGSLLVTGLKQAALSLSRSKKSYHTALYVDELDNFIERETFEVITSETRKFQLGLTVAIKTLQHLPEDFRNQLIISSGTICTFSVGKKDADTLGPQMFKVDGRKVKHFTFQNIINKVNSSPQFELISDEEKLNIDRLAGQEERTYFCYRVGTIAGVFHMKAHEFKDVSDKEVNWKLIDQICGNKGIDTPPAS